MLWGLRFGGGDSSSMSLWQVQWQDQGRENEIPSNKVSIVQPLSMKWLVEVLSTSPRGKSTEVASGVLNVAYTKTQWQQKFRKGKKNSFNNSV